MHNDKMPKHLKLVHTKKFVRHLFESVQICAKLGLARTRCFAWFELIIWSLRPIFGGQTSIILSKLWTCHCGELCINKIDGALIFAVLENNPKIWDCVRRVKIGLRSIFGMLISPQWYGALLEHKNLVHSQNLGAKLPVDRIYHAHPCLRKHPKFGVLCTSTVLAGKYVLLGVQRPYFACIHVRGPSFIERII